MSGRASLWIAAAVALVAVVTWWPVVELPFLDYDDSDYVVENPVVRAGLSLEGTWQALAGFRAANWHPVTWWSHQLDVSLFGLDPVGHHATSLLLHALNAALLFLWLDASVGPGGRRRSALVAALFAVHPVAVDSVAWVAERKNLLATGFGLGCLLAWTHYVRAPSRARYALAAAAFALGAMSKPMLVTLPGILLAIDLWPLARWPGRSLASLVVEKAPLLAISLAAAGLTVVAQSAGGAVESLDPFPLGLRVANAIVSLPTYLALVAWPAWPNGLAILHPHPGEALGGARVIAAGAVVAGLVAAVAVLGRKRRYLWLGALWGGFGLLPVIGLVQVGVQSHAERYAYFPMIGVLVAAVWLAADTARERGLPRALVGPLAISVLLALALLARGELRHWRSEAALFARAAELHERSGVETRHAMVLYYQLGTALSAEGRLDEAAASYRRALAANDDDPRPHNNLGSTLAALGRHDEAASHYEAALERAPAHPAALFNLALHEQRRGDPERARTLFVRFLEAGAPTSEARDAAIAALLELGAPDLAAAAALQARPRTPGLLALAAEGLRRSGRDREARDALVAALAHDPGSRTLRNNLAYLLATSADPAVLDPARAVAAMEALADEAPLDPAERDTLDAARRALQAGE